MQILEDTQDYQPNILRRFFTRQSSRRLSFVGLSFLAGAIFVSVMEFFGIYLPRLGGAPIFTVLFLIALFFAIAAIIVFSAVYLEIFGEDKVKIGRKLTELNEVILDRVQVLERGVNRIAAAQNSVSDLDEVVERIFSERIKDTIEARMSEDVKELASAELLAAYAPAIHREKSAASVKEFYGTFIAGIQQQLTKQQRNANFNVLLGMTFAIFGLLVMGYILYESYIRTGAGGLKGWEQFVFEFIPKLTFVVLFESIAFFFLQAYKDDRSMVRYLRNESTNVESRVLGLISGIFFGKESDIGAAVKTLLATERNFLIKKDEKVVLEALQGDSHILFDKVVERLVPDLSRRIADRVK